MKKVDQINQEIDDQIHELNSRGIKAKILVLGHMSYGCLKSQPGLTLEIVPNDGPHLLIYKDLRVIVDPTCSGPGVFRKEHEKVEVFGR